VYRAEDPHLKEKQRTAFNAATGPQREEGTDEK
jgi:hypothetical protein